MTIISIDYKALEGTYHGERGSATYKVRHADSEWSPGDKKMQRHDRKRRQETFHVNESAKTRSAC
jgi:hypothetical protein